MDKALSQKKKLTKKAKKGQINMNDQYRVCKYLGIKTSSLIEFILDKTRINSRHEVNISELRDLLRCLLSDRQPSKFFQIKNKAFIRHVVCIHLSDCNDSNLFEGLQFERVMTARVSKQHNNQYMSLTKKILTIDEEDADIDVIPEGAVVDADEIDDDDDNNNNSNNNNKAGSSSRRTQQSSSNSTGTAANGGTSAKDVFAQYVLSESAMRMWGYPLPLPPPPSSRVCLAVHEVVSDNGNVSVSASQSNMTSQLHDATTEGEDHWTRTTTETATATATATYISASVDSHDNGTSGCTWTSQTSTLGSATGAAEVAAAGVSMRTKRNLEAVEAVEAGAGADAGWTQVLTRTKRRPVADSHLQSKSQAETETSHGSEVGKWAVIGSEVSPEIGNLLQSRPTPASHDDTTAITKPAAATTSAASAAVSATTATTSAAASAAVSATTATTSAATASAAVSAVVSMQANKGVLAGAVPSVSEAMAILGALPRFQCEMEGVGADDCFEDEPAAAENREGENDDNANGDSSLATAGTEVKMVIDKSHIEAENGSIIKCKQSVDTDVVGDSSEANPLFVSTISQYDALWSVLHGRSLEEDKHSTLDKLHSSPLQMAALDCEMCDTAAGLELTRLSLVDSLGRTILDVLVNPDSPITNYRSQWSGITAVKMNGVNVKLVQVQIALLRLISAETMLIGHSLENDLKALQVFHTRCVDTSILYPHPRGFPLRRKLKTLAKEFLSISIQCASTSVSGIATGHDSIEDARAALSLAKLKFEKGPSFGLVISNDSQDGRLPLLSVLPASGFNSCLIWNHSEKTRLMKACTGGAANAIPCNNNHDAIKRAIGFIKSQTNNKFSSSSSSQLSSSLKSLPSVSTTSSLSNNTIIDETTIFPIIKQSLTYLSLHYDDMFANNKNELIKAINTIKNTVRDTNEDGVLLLTTQMSLKEVERLLKQRRLCQTALCASSWSAQQENELKQLIVEANYGRVGITMIHPKES